MDNSDWWAAELDVPAELFAMEFVFVDPASRVVDNNKYATRGHNSIFLIHQPSVFLQMIVAERTGIPLCYCKPHDGPCCGSRGTSLHTGKSLIVLAAELRSDGADLICLAVSPGLATSHSPWRERRRLRRLRRSALQSSKPRRPPACR